MNTKIASAIMGFTFFAAASSAFALQPGNTTNLEGTWVNANPATRSIVKVIVTRDASGFKVNTFGSCSPTPCDHGSIPASRFSDDISSNVAQGFSANYNFGFSTMLVTGQRVYDFDGGSFLQLTTHTRFAAGDTRRDYSRTELFVKQ